MRGGWLLHGRKRPQPRLRVQHPPEQLQPGARPELAGREPDHGGRQRVRPGLKAGRTSIATLLLDPPPWLESAKVLDMLLALPKVGRVKATKTLDSCRVSPSKTFGGLTDRQRAELASRLNE
ncbi:MAG: hypothetical protein ACLP8S_16340 [Solirubrobacteraceae bacterium]